MLTAMVDGAVLEKGTKGRAGIRWDSVVDNVWKDNRGEPRRGDVRRGVWEVHGRGRRNDRKKGTASAKKQGGIGKKHLRDIRGIERRNRNESVFARPNGLRENAGTAISCITGDHIK